MGQSHTLQKSHKNIQLQHGPQFSISPDDNTIVDETHDQISEDDINHMFIIESIPSGPKPIDTIHEFSHNVNDVTTFVANTELVARDRLHDINEIRADPVGRLYGINAKPTQDVTTIGETNSIDYTKSDPDVYDVNKTHESRKSYRYSSKTKDLEMYSLGIPLQYGYEHEIVREGAIKVQPAFGSLKEELTSNNILCLTIKQFQNDFKKAQVHFDSDHRKIHYPFLLLEHILALIIWCNYDALNYAFSETFRESEFQYIYNKICQYFHFGMNLKQAVHEHGTRIMDGTIKRFYRGLSKTLVFSETAIHINGPFSTTLSFEVAVQFAGIGVVVELRDELGFNKYFPVSWLSNYANERECLFIDNEYPLTIVNIVSASIFGNQYATILNTLSIIKKLITHQPLGDTDFEYYPKIQAICESMLSKTSLVVLDQYAKHLSDTFFANQTRIIIDHNWIRECPFMFDLSFKSVNGFTVLNINTLCVVFPNVEYITVLHAPLSTFLIDDIYTTLKTDCLNIKHIQLQAMHTQQMDLYPSLKRYLTLFKQIKYHMHGHQITNAYKENRLYGLCFYEFECNMPFPCRMSRYTDEVYNQYSHYFDSDPQASEFLCSIYEYRKDHQMNFVDDVAQLKALIFNFSAYVQHQNKLRAALQSYCGKDHPLMHSLFTDVAPATTTDYFMKFPLKTSEITLSECVLEVSDLEPIVVPADSHRQQLVAAKTIISQNETLCNESKDDGIFALEYLKEAIELKTNRDLSDMISNTSYDRDVDAEDVNTLYKWNVPQRETNLLNDCDSPAAFASYTHAHNHAVLTCHGDDDDDDGSCDNGNSNDKQSPPGSTRSNSTNNDNSDNNNNQQNRSNGSNAGNSSGGGGGRKPNDRDNSGEEAEDGEDENEDEDEDEENENEEEPEDNEVDNDAKEQDDHIIDCDAKKSVLNPIAAEFKPQSNRLETVLEGDETQDDIMKDTEQTMSLNVSGHSNHSRSHIHAPTVNIVVPNPCGPNYRGTATNNFNFKIAINYYPFISADNTVSQSSSINTTMQSDQQKEIQKGDETYETVEKEKDMDKPETNHVQNTDDITVMGSAISGTMDGVVQVDLKQGVGTKDNVTMEEMICGKQTLSKLNTIDPSISNSNDSASKLKSQQKKKKKKKKRRPKQKPKMYNYSGLNPHIPISKSFLECVPSAIRDNLCKNYQSTNDDDDNVKMNQLHISKPIQHRKSKHRTLKPPRKSNNVRLNDYIIGHIVMQCDLNDEKRNEPQAIHFGFMDNNDLLYGIFQQNQLNHQLYTSSEVQNTFCIPQLPVFPINTDAVESTRILEMLSATTTLTNIINRCPWQDVSVLRRDNRMHNIRNTLEMQINIFRRRVIDFIGVNGVHLIPMFLSNSQRKWSIHNVCIVTISLRDQPRADIGISFKRNNTGGVYVTGILLDGHSMRKVHQLMDPYHKCGCVDLFTSYLDDFRIICNADYEKDRARLVQEKHQLVAFLLKYIGQSNFDIESWKHEARELVTAVS
eukprot:959102_1